MKPLIVSLIVFLGCTSTTSNTTPTASQAPGQQAQGQQAQGQRAQSEHKNLQILPRDIPREQLIAIMRNFTRSLGVRCNHCHVVTATEPKEVLDFPSDAKEEKRVARVMMQMTTQINGAWMERVEQAEGHEEVAAHANPAAQPYEMRVSCWTCHRGHPEPEMPPPPPPQNAPR